MGRADFGFAGQLDQDAICCPNHIVPMRTTTLPGFCGGMNL